MDTRKRKGKRIEMGFRQKDIAFKLGLSAKTMCLKERSAKNRFTADEMAQLAVLLQLSSAEFNQIFFNGDLPFV